jgi:hypothetical protein
MRTNLGALLASIVFSVAGAANAGVINFTYTGTDPFCATCSESGSGSFSLGFITTSVPEPSVLALLSNGLGIAGIGYAGIGFEYLKKRRRAAASERCYS